ncbi:Helix-turn-helix domain-containing protein [Fodinibius roseus]|uniref:Helix-turn-helix domain-containing protein n=1 Tax=Fodinibius roseus TaxID=1194090 RepID=A0A1M5MA13_9BACT|nr:helix-turn-helix domain-containing protein [Fodinibius roseus]SHG74086.1 Helix-turn-helix domain-containing protein [Fodinibius roseus]
MAKSKVKAGYYSIIPAKVRYDDSLTPNAKLMYGELTSLSNKEGYAFARNEYFADLYDVSKRTISRWISQLKKNDYIQVHLSETAKGTERRISIIGIDSIVPRGGHKDPNPPDSNSKSGEDKNSHHNIGSSSNITRRTTTIDNLPEITPAMKKVIEGWNDTFKVVVDDSDKKLLEAISNATKDFSVADLLQAIEYRSQAKFYKEDYPHLRNNPRSFFGYPQTIKNDMNRRPYKLITYSKKCELEQQGTDKRFEIDPKAKDSKGQPKWRMYD